MMTLELTPREQLVRVRADLRMGVPVVLEGGGAAALVLAAETAGAARLAELRGFGPVDMAISDWRAETLKARAYDGDLARVVLPRDADLDWVRATADPSAGSDLSDEGTLCDTPGRLGGVAPGGDPAVQAGASVAGGAGGGGGP